MPAVIGSYRPMYKSTEEELSPGMIRLRPQTRPQNTKLSALVSAWPVMPRSSRLNRKYARASDSTNGVQLIFASLRSESLISSGSVPQIRPKKSISATVAEALNIASTTLASSVKPSTQPIRNGMNIL